MDAELRAAHQKLSVLHLAESLRTRHWDLPTEGSFMEPIYREQAQISDPRDRRIEGLTSNTQSNPLAILPEQVERIFALSQEFPTLGCNELCDSLGLEGIKISYPTIQNILNKHGMGART